MKDIIRTNCPRDCYDGCGILVERSATGPHRVLGDPDHPVSRGKLCSKCAVAYNGVWQDPEARLTTPMRRVGSRGNGQFVPISWDEALSTVSQRIEHVIDQQNPAAILHTHYSGTLALIGYQFPNRFFNYLGASEVDPDTICNAAGHVAWHLLFGNSVMGFDPRTAKDAACIVVWGANPAHSAPHVHAHWLTESPAKVVVIDPIRTQTAVDADLHLQPRPGTDAALAYALLHCLRAAGSFDDQFIDKCTLGFDEIEAFIDQATPAWGQEQTGVAAADIERAAALYGAGPALLWCGQGLQRQATGGNVMRAAGLLPALTGNIGKPGAGFYYLNVTPAVAGIDFDWLGGAGIARTGGKTVSHMDLADRLTDEQEFKVFFCWNTNPLASAPNQTRLRKALMRDDLFTVVCDLFMTDTASYADIVLPAASFLEYDDITFNYFFLHMGAQAKVSDPPGEALPNAEIFRRLAANMNLDEPALYESDESLLGTMMMQMDPGFDFAELKRRGYFVLTDEPTIWWSDHQFDTPSRRVEIASSQAEKMGLPRVPQPWADAPAPNGQLRLLTPASLWRLNGSYANDPHLRKQSDKSALHLNPRDADLRGIKQGDTVVVSNDAGTIRLSALLDDAVLDGSVVVYKGCWPGLEDNHQNINFVCVADKADMGDSTSVHSTLVNVMSEPE